MCLATPVKVIEILNENRALVEKDGVFLSVSTLLFPSLQLGNYVLVHAGFIIQKIDDGEAFERIEMINELYKGEI